MSLKSKIEAVIYASEEPVTLPQLVVLLSEEAQAELDALAARQSQLPLDGTEPTADEPDAAELATAEATPADAEVPDAAGQPRATEEQADHAADVEPSTTPTEPAAEPDRNGADAGSTVNGSEPTSPDPADKRLARERERAIREYLREIVDGLMREYAEADRGLEIREVAGGFRFGTKPEYHDAVRGFVKSLKPALRLSLQALETLAVVAYKQPVTAAEISEIRGVDSAGVLGGLLTRKLIQTAGRKQVIGRPMLYKTTKEFLVRFGLRDVQELPSMEEFERMAGELAEQEDLPMEGTENIIERANARGDAEHIRETNQDTSGDEASPVEEAGQAPPSQDASHGGEEPDGIDVSRENEVPAPQETASGSSPRSEAEPLASEQERP